MSQQKMYEEEPMLLPAVIPQHREWKKHSERRNYTGSHGPGLHQI